MKKTFLFLLTVLLISSGFSCQGDQSIQKPVVNTNQPIINQPVVEQLSYTDITAQEALKFWKENQDLIIIDVSPHYAKGHLPGAINYYVGDGSLDKGIKDLDPSKTYLVYCHVDSAAILGAQKLIDAGFGNVYRLLGNYSGWLKLNYPVEISLVAVGEYTGGALAIRSYIDNQFEHIVSADLPTPAPGKFYEGWLVKTSPKLEFFSTGKLTRSEVPSIHSFNMLNLFYTDSVNHNEFNQVVITEETEANGLDGIPEAHVLEGQF